MNRPLINLHLRVTSGRAARISSLLRMTVATSFVTLLLAGCASKKATVCDLQYCDDIVGVSDHRTHNGSIAYPCLDNQTVEAVAVSHEPRNLQRRIEDQPREITLADALRTALAQNEVIETTAFGGTGAKAVLTNPTNVASVYDPAIQSSGVLFGRRSVESALADFDTTFTTGITSRRSDINQGGSFAGGGNRTDFTTSLRKQFATGASISFNHDWTYSGDIPSVNGSKIDQFARLGAQYRHPLLAGSGVDYTRIAGPANPNFGSITGVSQGVVIARINQDISIADFQVAVRNGLRDIENTYWDLYLAYRTYDTSVVAHQSAFQTWREAQDRLEVGVLKPADELQARDRLYETKASVETNLNTLYKAETELRRLIGLPMNDGTVLVPVDEPVVAEFIPDWRGSLCEGLTHRVELRRQKWALKSLQLQLQAARSLVRPRLDFIAGYDVHGAGDNFLGQSNRPLDNVYGSMNSDDINAWNLGLEMSMPLGFRFTRSQVRNLELQIAKASAVLASQEKNIAHDIATSIQDVTAAYTSAQSNYKRLKAAARRVELLEAEREIGTLTLDLVLRAQSSLAAAENAFYQDMVSYNKAITALHLSKGSLLEHNGIFLAEGGWDPAAYCDSSVRAHARTHAVDAPYLCTQPPDFASPGPAGSVNLRSDDPTIPYEANPGPAFDPPDVPMIIPPDAPAPQEVPNIVPDASTSTEFESLLEPPAALKSYRRKAPRSAFIESDFPGYSRAFE